MNEQYLNYLNSPKWQSIRIKCLHRANKQCEACKCGSSHRQLQVHHLTYERIFRERLKDLLVLCEKCHKLAEALITKGVIGRKGSPADIRTLTMKHLRGEFLPSKQPKIVPRNFKRIAKLARNKHEQQQNEKWLEARRKYGKPKSSMDSRYYKLGSNNAVPKIKY